MIRFTGNFDFDLDHVSEEFIEKQLSSGSKNLVLDMAEVKKMASSFINRLVRILRVVDREKGRLYLLNVPDQAIKVLSMVNIIGRFPIFQSEEELLAMHGADGDNKGTPTLTLSRQKEIASHRISLSGSVVEGANTGALLEEVRKSLDEGAPLIILDFARVNLLDTISVGLLLMIQKMGEEKRVSIRIENANSVSAHVLQMNEVGRLFGL